MRKYAKYAYTQHLAQVGQGKFDRQDIFMGKLQFGHARNGILPLNFKAQRISLILFTE